MSTIHLITAAGLAALCAIAGYRLAARRMTRLCAALAAATRAAGHDRLTGLPNRNRLTSRVVQIAASRQPITLAIINLDKFAHTNHFGHRVGDQLLVLLAGRLRYHAGRHGATAYRLTGDEFAVVWPHPHDTAHAAATRLLAALREPVELLIDEHPVHLRTTATAGLADLAQPAGDPTGLLLTRANTALQHGKHTARGTATLWQPQLPDLPRPRRDSRHTAHRDGKPCDAVRDAIVGTPNPVYGLIEWDGSYTPTVIVGCCRDAVRRTAVDIFGTTGGAHFAADSPDFLAQHPNPGPNAPAEAITDWLDALREATTEPWFSVLDSDEVVRTADRLLLMDLFSATPYVSRPGDQPDSTAERCDRCRQPATAPPITVDAPANVTEDTAT
ncbi:hypothetical protein Rhe02_37610 [Rhizocola hellebori]|uniref:GGDEF domain-containing protein n=1 Tax=Rhizocola hellebori TaxID=1392758 RepID=A0A8J3VFU9_9ACTN|nr:GGDEF domain-containing protein [Rhizocola hellebori]GIH05694.1 hypothetical protein Rhe02_37610 [Rhizocola hellebori]